MSNECPSCGERGRVVSAATIGAHVPSLEGKVDGWSLCSSPGCHTIYFRGSERIDGDAMRSLPFHKSRAPDRVVCFCFRHTAADLRQDLKLHGRSRIRDEIKAACKAGRDDCETKNPQGRCCLGNVGEVLGELDNCCD